MNSLFIFLVVGLGALTFYGLWRIFDRKGILIGIILSAWLGTLGIFAKNGFFSEFQSTPPRLVFVLFPSIALLLFLSRWKSLPDHLILFSTFPFVFFQSFRILMEWILHCLIEAGRLPEILTFTGDNFDILVGITAPFMALALLREKKLGVERIRKIAIVWNILAFLILTNTVVHGVLAVPTPFQVFHTTPPNTLIADFPWIWLPGFVVPLALLGHLLSIRQLLRLQQQK